jgi:putative transposase
MEEHRIYSRDFKEKAIKLVLEKNRFKAAKELGIAHSIVYRWYEAYKKFGEESFYMKHVRNPEQKRFSEQKRTLQKKLRDSEIQVEIFKKASKHIVAGKPMIFHFIEDNLDTYPLWKMCKALGILTGTYHKWKSQEKSPRQQQTNLLEQEITSIFYEYKERYGNIRISEELKSKGIKLSPCQVTFYMKKLGLVSKLGRRNKSKFSSPFIPYNPCIFPNILDRQFNVERPSQVWVSAITSIETVTGLVFLTIIMDLFDRKIIGWSLSDGRTIRETSIPAWEMAAQDRRIETRLLFHSDRGPQYANKAFTRRLASYKSVKRSMSRPGNHLDNAIPRKLFSTLKSELARSSNPLTKEQIEEIIIAYSGNHTESTHRV